MLFNLAGFQEAVHQKRVQNDTVRLLFVVVFKFQVPSGESTVQLTDRMFLWTSSMGPGLWEILSLRSSANRARFSCSCLACRDGSADVSAEVTTLRPIMICRKKTWNNVR